MEETKARSFAMRNSVRWDRLVDGQWSSLVSGAKIADPMWSGKSHSKLE